MAGHKPFSELRNKLRESKLSEEQKKMMDSFWAEFDKAAERVLTEDHELLKKLADA